MRCAQVSNGMQDRAEQRLHSNRTHSQTLIGERVQQKQRAHIKFHSLFFFFHLFGKEAEPSSVCVSKKQTAHIVQFE